mmetsp:Transcript_88154/g.284626  ORF Transcript_88154/g.284626 Transcript_88154/m.284626 type:complete len:200 (+) Transcript_88154:817-1416(+)
MTSLASTARCWVCCLMPRRQSRHPSPSRTSSAPSKTPTPCSPPSSSTPCRLPPRASSANGPARGSSCCLSTSTRASPRPWTSRVWSTWRRRRPPSSETGCQSGCRSISMGLRRMWRISWHSRLNSVAMRRRSGSTPTSTTRTSRDGSSMIQKSRQKVAHLIRLPTRSMRRRGLPMQRLCETAPSGAGRSRAAAAPKWMC